MSEHYPAQYDALNHEHAEIQDELSQLQAAGDETPNVTTFRQRLWDFLQLLQQHHRHEEDIMSETTYPDAALHTAYHRHSAGVIDTIIRLYDADATAELGERIAAHVANAVQEEIFFDRQLMAFLSDR